VKGFNLRLDETGSSNIKLENSIPVTDEIGKQTEPYSFSITNEDSSETGYVIYLDDETIDSEINRMKDTVVKYQLIENGNEKVDLVSELGTSPFRILTSGVIGGNTTNTYSLRFWMKEDAEVSTNQIFNVKLRIIATSKEAINEGKLVFGDTIITSDNGVTSMTSDELQNYIDKVLEGKIVDQNQEEATAGYHNSIFRGRNITNYYEDGSLYTRISDGTFKDLYVGDYIVKNGIAWRIAGFDMYLKKGDVPTNLHHAVIVPDKHLTTEVMNDTDTTAGGYVESKMYKETLPSILNTYISPIFGDHIIEHRSTLTGGINETGYNRQGTSGGCSNKWVWSSKKLDLMSEIQVFGTITWSSSGYEGGSEVVQFPLFRLAPEFIGCREKDYWLKDITDATGYSFVTYAGTSNARTATSNLGIRPYFFID